jgi:TonB family protein
VIRPLFRVSTFLIAAALTLPVIVRAQSTETHVTPQGNSPKPNVVYPDTTAGLKQLASDLWQAQKENNSSRAEELLESFLLPNFRQWYADKFNDVAVERVVPVYAAIAPRIPSQLASVFLSAYQEDFRNIAVVRYDEEQDACLNASPQTFAGVMSRRTRVPLYELRFTHGDRYKHLFAFAYVDGTFRFVLTPDYSKPGPNPAGGSDQRENRIPVGAVVQSARLVCRYNPIYPEDARMRHISGTVRLHVIVGKDGSVKELQAVSGPDALIGTSREAVSRWRYRPTLLNGEPVEIDTTIDVIFSLNN